MYICGAAYRQYQEDNNVFIANIFEKNLVYTLESVQLKKTSESVDSGSKKKVKKNASKEAKKEVEIAPESNATDNDEGV